MPILVQNDDFVWAERMAIRVRRAYIGKHVTRVIGSTAVGCLVFFGVFIWQPWCESSIDSTVTAEFLSVQVEETYSQVYTTPENTEDSIFTL